MYCMLMGSESIVGLNSNKELAVSNSYLRGLAHNLFQSIITLHLSHDNNSDTANIWSFQAICDSRQRTCHVRPWDSGAKRRARQQVWGGVSQVLTSVAALVHHQHIGANANYPTDITLELPVGQADAPGRGVALGVGARLGAVHSGPWGPEHAQVFRTLLLAIDVTGEPVLLVTARLNFNVTGWKRGQGEGPRFRIRGSFAFDIL